MEGSIWKKPVRDSQVLLLRIEKRKDFNVDFVRAEEHRNFTNSNVCLRDMDVEWSATMEKFRLWRLSTQEVRILERGKTMAETRTFLSDMQ